MGRPPGERRTRNGCITCGGLISGMSTCCWRIFLAEAAVLGGPYASLSKPPFPYSLESSVLFRHPRPPTLHGRVNNGRQVGTASFCLQAVGAGSSATPQGPFTADGQSPRHALLCTCSRPRPRGWGGVGGSAPQHRGLQVERVSKETEILF